MHKNLDIMVMLFSMKLLGHWTLKYNFLLPNLQWDYIKKQWMNVI